MYKLIALDLDGTLTDKNKNILEETKQELIKLAQKGVIIVLASGRPTAGIFKEAKELTLDQVGGYLLSFNGIRRGRDGYHHQPGRPGSCACGRRCA